MEKHRYIDIHCHALYGVDDGSADLEESLAMLRRAADEGIGKIILTPHQKPDRRCVSMEGLQKRIEALQEAAEGEGIPIRLYPGGELFYRAGLEEELEAGTLPTLAGSGYVLVEFYPQEQYPYLRDGLYRLLAAGYSPVLAHAERYAEVCRKKGRLEELLDMGCYCQVNASSLTGEQGFGMKQLSWRLVKEGLVHFVATDAHRAKGGRSPQLSKCAAMLEKRCGSDAAARLLYENARKVLEDEEI